MGLERKIAVVVVTYNRLSLLKSCLLAISSQSRQPDRLFVVDNCSNDGTTEALPSLLEATGLAFELIRLSENLGGAGGFCKGLGVAIDQGFDSVWMMDDDALPNRDALERLVFRAVEPLTLYGSIAYCGDKTSWSIDVHDKETGTQCVSELSEIKPIQEVSFIPFLGIFVSRDIVNKIGLPDPNYFICSDDVEYSMRASVNNIRIVMCGESLIEHPRSEEYIVPLGVKLLRCRRLTPWKRYYETRNRIMIAKKYYGLRAYWQTLPASFLRLFAALLNESNKLMQLKAFYAGLSDGLFGRMGARHKLWGL